MATRAPCCTNSAAVAWPIPEVPPVMSATLPSNCIVILLHSRQSPPHVSVDLFAPQTPNSCGGQIYALGSFAGQNFGGYSGLANMARAARQQFCARRRPASAVKERHSKQGIGE